MSEQQPIPNSPDGAVLRSRLRRIDVVCTGGIYNDPELGPTPRHGTQKVGQIPLTRTGRASQLYERGKPMRCPQCGRNVPVAGSWPVEDPDHPASHPETGLRYEAGVWLRIAGWAAREFPDRRVVSVDISDSVYPW